MTCYLRSTTDGMMGDTTISKATPSRNAQAPQKSATGGGILFTQTTLIPDISVVSTRVPWKHKVIILLDLLLSLFLLVQCILSLYMFIVGLKDLNELTNVSSLIIHASLHCIKQTFSGSFLVLTQYELLL